MLNSTAAHRFWENHGVSKDWWFCNEIPVGTHMKRGYKRMCSPQVPFSHLSCHSQPKLRHKFIHKTLILKKNITFCLKNETFSENMPFYSHRGSNLPRFPSKSCEILVLKPVFDKTLLTRPHFHGNLSTHKRQVWKFGPHIPTRKNVEYPPLRWNLIVFILCRGIFF